MNSRRLTWVLGALVAIIAVVLIAKYGIKTTHTGPSADDHPDYSLDDAKGGGRDLTWKSARAHVWLPGYPSHTDQSLSTPNGPVDFHAFSHDGDRISCTLAWMGRAAADTRTSTQIFDEAGRNVSKTVDGKILAEREVQLGTYAGKEFQMSASTPRVGSYRVRTWVVGPRVYTMTVFMMPGAEVDPETDRFFDSLEVTDLENHVLHPAAAPPPVLPDRSSVYVSMTQEAPKGTFRTLLVHRDGVVELLASRDGPVARRTAKGTADLEALKRVFEGAAWRALPERPDGGADPSMYAIETGGRTIRRADPLSSVEPAFLSGMSALGTLWLYAERAERPAP